MNLETLQATCSNLTLEQVLRAREARALRQQEWLIRYKTPLVSATLVWPGEVKDTPLSRRVMAQASDALGELFSAHGWAIGANHLHYLPTGPEAFWSISAPAWMIKHVTAHLEDIHPLGRLWDIDVICPTAGLIKRSAIRQPMRKCFICDEPAHACARARRHAANALAQVIEDIASDYFSSQR